VPANGFLHHPKERCKNSGKKSFTWHQQHLGTVVLAQHSSLHALVVLILFYMLACFFLFDGESGERERLSLLLSAVKSRDETRDETQVRGRYAVFLSPCCYSRELLYCTLGRGERKILRAESSHTVSHTRQKIARRVLLRKKRRATKELASQICQELPTERLLCQPQRSLADGKTTNGWLPKNTTNPSPKNSSRTTNEN
jgi:hypothetical protein